MKSIQSTSRSGVALVIVLGFLVVLTTLMVAFFTSTQTDRRVSRSYSDSVTVKHLADLAAKVVMSQVYDATKTFEVTNYLDPNVNNPLADPYAVSGQKRLLWASQPGAIWTWEVGTPSLLAETANPGTRHRIYRLYSNDTMVVPPGAILGDMTAGNRIDSEWVGKPAFYTDLNEPVLAESEFGKINVGGKKFYAQYPIIDPLALGKVEGFRLAPPSTFYNGPDFSSLGVDELSGRTNRPQLIATLESHNPTAKIVSRNRGASKTANPAAMPVQWLYVLANGTLTSPEPGSDGMIASWGNLSALNANAPSRDNPIVGRIAFWTDDETSKLNINVNSEGVFWDRAYSNAAANSYLFAERNLHTKIPVRGEYQRYPGHPATTSLSTVLSGMFPITVGGITSINYPPASLQRIYDIIPRVANGGSDVGQVDTRAALTASVLPDADRLYASVDEMVFTPSYSGSGLGRTRGFATQLDPAASNTGNPTALQTLRNSLEQSRFFLTTSNRSSDTNVFNLPRVSLWPANGERDANLGKPNENGTTVGPYPYRNSMDKLLVFASTVGGRAFYFQRRAIYLRNAVNNRTVEPMGPHVRQIPERGFVPPSSQLPYSDWGTDLSTSVPSNLSGGNSFLRNQALWNYLRVLTSTPAPGWGGQSLNARYNQAPFPNDRGASSATGSTVNHNTLVSMIDHLRSGVNGYSPNSLQPSYQFLPARGVPDAASGETQCVPLAVPSTMIGGGSLAINTPYTDTTEPRRAGVKGFGRFPTVGEAGFVFYRTNGDTDAQGKAQPKKFRILFVMETFSPTSGSYTWSPLTNYVVRGLESVSIKMGDSVVRPFQPWETSTGTKLPFQNLVTSRCGYASGGGHTTPNTGTVAMFRRWNGSQKDANKIFPKLKPDGTPELIVPSQLLPEEEYYLLVSREVTTPKAGDTSFDIVGGDVQIDIHSGFALKPSVDTVVQSLRLKFPPAPGIPLPLLSDQPDLNQRMPDNQAYRIIRTGDTVRTLEPSTVYPVFGDLRMIAGARFVPPSYFEAPRGSTEKFNYFSQTERAVHSLRYGNDASTFMAGGDSEARLVAGVNATGTASLLPYHASRTMKSAQLAGLSSTLGDWDNGAFDLSGVAMHRDGALINKPEDYILSEGGNSSVTTPFRQVNSPVTFGSIPTGEAWRTLLFTPEPASGKLHPSNPTNLDPLKRATKPGSPDHLYLDLWHMPIAEPYAISEPLSTQGRVNINYGIEPFDYITRSTGVRAVLKSTQMAVIPNSTPNYKASSQLRYPVYRDETIKALEAKLLSEGQRTLFRTASEICEVPLIPQGVAGNPTTSTISSWWQQHLLTGDNLREAPYGHIYSRITTKSNTFTVHMRVQTLKKSDVRAGATQAEIDKHFKEWNEDRDQVASEYRGSLTFERYIDANDPLLSNPAYDLAPTGPAADDVRKRTLDRFYKMRVIYTRRFLP